MITESMIPMVIVPTTFLFVLLIILITKAPKAGAWIVGSLMLLAPIFLWRLAAAGALRHAEAIPLVVVPLTFLFVLMVILLAKAPKVGASLIVALVVMVVLGLFLIPIASYRHASDSPAEEYTVAQIRQQAEQAAAVQQRIQTIKVWEGFRDSMRQPPAPVPAAPAPQPPAVASPIWSPGVEQEFEADTYPSRIAAVRALGSRMYRLVREIPQDGNSPAPIVLFQQEQDRTLIVELKNAVKRLLPERVCTIEAEMRNLQPAEIGVTLQFVGAQENPAPWARSSGAVVVSRGDVEVNVFTADRRATAHQSYTEKPWVEDFAGFANARPELQFVVARSYATCTSAAEAHDQALDDARSQITRLLGDRREWKVARLPAPAVTQRDVLDGRFIIDRFDQSFEGSAGKIWRQALLIDVSGPKLAQLADQKARELREMKMSWARMGFSAIGVIVLIGAIYFFLNMATRGYYEWSLRIAGIVLAIVAVISILMVVR
jgi:hypothetical protein